MHVQSRPPVPPKPLRLAHFMPGERQALMQALHAPLPPESDVLGRCRTDNGEIKTFRGASGLRRLDVTREEGKGEETLRTFNPGEAEPATPRGRIRAIETRALGSEGTAPAVHTIHYADGLKHTVAESEGGELYWLGLRAGDAPRA